MRRPDPGKYVFVMEAGLPKRGREEVLRYRRRQAGDCQSRDVRMWGQILLAAQPNDAGAEFIDYCGTEYMRIVQARKERALARGAIVGSSIIAGQSADGSSVQIAVETVFAAAGTTLTLSGNTTALTPYQGSMTVRLKENRKHLDIVAQALRKSERLMAQDLKTLLPDDRPLQNAKASARDVE